jgi:hypothetical protein
MDKKNIIILVLIAIFGYILLSNNNKTIAEKFVNAAAAAAADAAALAALRKQIMDVYRIDVEAIKNLSKIANEIANNGKFSVPTDLMIAGGITSSGRIDASGSITVQTNDSVGIATNNDIVATGNIRAKADISDSVGTLASVRALAVQAQNTADGSNIGRTPQTAERMFVKEICIGNTCINEDHFKILTGQSYVNTRNERNNECYDFRGGGMTSCNNPWANVRLLLSNRQGPEFRF